MWIVRGLPAIASDTQHLVIDTGAVTAAMSPTPTCDTPVFAGRGVRMRDMLSDLMEANPTTPIDRSR